MFLSGYDKSYNSETKWIYIFLFEDDELLEKYNEI